MPPNDAIFLAAKGAPGSSVRRRGRWLRRLAWVVLGLCLTLPIAYLVFLRATRIVPPPVAPARVAAARALPLTVDGAVTRVGPNWMARTRGVWEIHLEGEPYAMGHAHARLGSFILRQQEDYLFGEMERFVPSRVARFFIRAGVRLRYRKLPEHVPPDLAEEIAGLADGTIDSGGDRHADFLPAYHRIVFYHALHDITQGVEKSPLLGCTGFAAAGAATVGGHLVVGRNFDFEGPEIFDSDKAVLFFKPRGKIPFASVAWTGMAGVVTGMNAERIYVSINAARTDDKGKDGQPVELLVRRLLEEARSIDDVIRLVKATPVMVPDFYLVADGKTGESAVIERSPTRLEVRRSKDVTLLANHALTPAFEGDAENDRLRRYLTSGARHARLEELVGRARGQIDPRRALDILRDKKGQGGSDLGLGNRRSLDALIATHSVVADVTEGLLWVGEGPHLLGRFRGFDLRKELLSEDRSDPVDLPADPVGGSPEHQAYLDARRVLAVAEQLIAAGDDAHALPLLERAEGLAPRLPEIARQKGDLLRRQGDLAGARRAYRRFLELEPPYLKDIEEVKGLLATL
jgi:hypothetical protein